MCVKKLIFSKFAGLEAHSRQRYYHMDSFTGIFRQHFKPPSCSPHVLTKPPPSPTNLEEPPHVLNTCGKPCIGGGLFKT